MVLFALLFVWCPLFGIIVYALFLNHRKEVPVTDLWSLALMLSLYLGGLAVTKELLGDFLEYHRYFQDVPNYTLSSYIFRFGKEPLFYGYTYLSYYLFMGNWNLYVISITTANYLLLSYCILKIGTYLNATVNTLMVSLFFMAFFFQEFAAIGNMLRQGLAQSMTLAFLVRWYIVGKRSWWLAVCALATHTSCLPVLGIGLFPLLQKRLELVTFIRFCGVVAILAGLFFAVGGLLSNLPFIGYIFERISNTEQLLSADSWQTEVGLQPSMLVLLFLLGYMIFSLYRSDLLREEDSRLYIFINLNLMLLLMMVICNVFGMYYLLMRYFFYLYAFQNSLFVIYLHESAFLQKPVVHLSIVCVMMGYFFYNFTTNIFDYIPVVEAVVYPLPVYLFI